MCSSFASRDRGTTSERRNEREHDAEGGNEEAKEERASERVSERLRWEEREKKRRQRASTSFLSRLPGRTVCILSRAAPREFNSIFNLPKPLYANSSTDVEYFWTFSSRFRVPSVHRRHRRALLVYVSLSLCLSLLSHFDRLFLSHSFFSAASFHSNPSSERRHTFLSLLASFTNVAKRVFGGRF